MNGNKIEKKKVNNGNNSNINQKINPNMNNSMKYNYYQPMYYPYQTYDQRYFSNMYPPNMMNCQHCNQCKNQHDISEMSNQIKKLTRSINYLKKKINNMSSYKKKNRSKSQQRFNCMENIPPPSLPTQNNNKPKSPMTDDLLVITLKPEKNNKSKLGPKGGYKNGVDDLLISTIINNMFGPILKKNKPNTQSNDNAKEELFELDLNAKYDQLDKKVETLDDLINLAKQYKPLDKKIKPNINLDGGDTTENSESFNSEIVVENKKTYSFDMKMLYNILEPMEKLNGMVGWKDIKKSITEFIIYHSQRLEKQQEDMFHTVIQGPPGVGKTELGKILGKIYKGMGIIKSDKFKIVRRSDLVGQYLGHTAAKTQDIIDDCEGGVMFIDEAYSLGNPEGKDIYSKECIDTLNANLSENKKKFICIIAGYQDSLEKCFFAYNEGLRRRFSFKYTIDGYKPAELCKIFAKKARDNSFEFDEDMLKSNEMEKFFKENKDSFPDYGGDMETLLLNCKITHSNRIFGKHPKYRKKINKEDIKNGLKRFLLHRQLNNDDRYKYSMYN